MESHFVPKGIEGYQLELGLPNETKDWKYDGDKIFGSLPFTDFPLAQKAVAEVGTMGAKKYARHSWQKVTNKEERYEDAFYRHILALNAGEELDSESKLSHRAHIAWNALALLEMYLQK